MKGYLRDDGRKGIRNIIAVAYLVECAHHVARKVVVASGRDDVHLIGFPGCFPNTYAFQMMRQLCTHPNVGGVLLVSLGCEGFNNTALAEYIEASGRPVSLVTIQQQGGTLKTIETGSVAVNRLVEKAKNVPRIDLEVSDLVIGTICGGSDGTSGISANPAVGRAFDDLIRRQATCIFEETGELIGCESIMANRAKSAEVAAAIREAIAKADRYYTTLGYGSFAPGNADGGLTTIEEKSMGAYAKSGAAKIQGVIKPGELPPSVGLFLLDIVPDGEPRFGFPNISDNAEIVELIACGCHLILFTTGRGSVVGSAISPVIKICANPETFARLQGDMDINAGAIIEGYQTIDAVGEEKESLINLATSGIDVVCYNFMPVLDWTRTDLSYPLPTGATCMRFDLADFVVFDIHILKRKTADADYSTELREEAACRFSKMDSQRQQALIRNVVFGLPGAAKKFTLDDVRQHLADYTTLSEDDLRHNLVTFLELVAPLAEELGIRLCCHPDDPPVPLLGLPRIMSTENDYRKIIEAVDIPANGITLCAGSLGARPDNDLPGMMARLGNRVHFLHLRNVKRETPDILGSFHETEHLLGDTDMVALIQAVLDEETRRRENGWANSSIPFRPDHGQDILDDLKRNAQPGYSAIGRLKGLAEIRGVISALTHPLSRATTQTL